MTSWFELVEVFLSILCLVKMTVVDKVPLRFYEGYCIVSKTRNTFFLLIMSHVVMWGRY